MTAENKQVHTTLPFKYWDYAKNELKLSWSQLLKDAIENEMKKNLDTIEKRIEINEKERKQLLQDYKKAIREKQKEKKARKIKLGGNRYD